MIGHRPNRAVLRGKRINQTNLIAHEEQNPLSLREAAIRVIMNTGAVHPQDRRLHHQAVNTSDQVQAVPRDRMNRPGRVLEVSHREAPRGHPIPVRAAARVAVPTGRPEAIIPAAPPRGADKLIDESY